MNDTLTKIKNGDLYALLSVCSDADLAPLVEVITKRLTNFLDVHDDYKKYAPHHSKYHSVIGDQIRRLGGNTISNLWRRGEGPSYEEIVIDVCKKLDIPCELGNTVKNENNLLSIYLERQWKTLSQKEQEQIIAEAREKASHQAGNWGALAKEGGGLLFARLALGPIGWGAIVFTMGNPAFKVTIPCVLHISYLRRKFLASLANSPSSSTGPSGSTVTVVERSTPLIIGTSEEETLLSLTRVSEPNLSNWQPVDDNNEGISRLNPLLQAVPSLVTAQNVASTKYMEVVINGPLLKAKGKEGYRLITMINGKPSHGTLLDPPMLSNIINVSALLQIASVAVAQKHLADISQNLTEIKACVERIHQFQKNERRSVLTGAIRYFDQVAQSVLAGELSDSVRNQLERHEAELIQVQCHLWEDIRHESEQIAQVKDTDTFGSKGMQEAIMAHQVLLGDLYQQLLLGIRARACGWQLLAVFPGEDHLKETRKRNIQEALEGLKETGDLLRDTDRLMRQKIRNISSMWNTGRKLNERKLSLIEWNDDLIEQVATTRAAIDQDIHAAEAVISELREPVKMVLRIEGDKIVSACAA